QAIDLPRYGSRNRGIELERVPQLEPLARPLADLGHSVRFEEQTSGLHVIAIDSATILGGADPRREGVAVGD
ncbi:MAG: gamma-glutamyltransferase, partial [Burkholderiales bacterium]|nr:gamma-glutamyltransferase [Burkholderiales bacterium]